MKDQSGVILLLLVLASCLLAKTAAGSCMSYGHSCWGAHGKRSDVVPEVASSSSSDENTWTQDEVESWPQWRKLRRVAQRSRLADGDNNTDDTDTPPPPRWLYQLMKQAAVAATKLQD